MRKETITLNLFLLVGIMMFVASCDEEMVKYTFPHQPHHEQEMTCDMCHELDDNGSMAMPVFDTCLTCHEGEAEYFESCNACHTDPPAQELDGDLLVSHQNLFQEYMPAGWNDVQMDHEAYIDMDEGNCLACHEEIQNSAHSSLANLPNMEHTMDFHDEHGLSNECSACHLELNKLTPPASHDQSWDRQHGFAREFQDMDSCLLCHEQETCTTCHQTQKPRNHNNLWRKQTHGIQAAFERDSCLVCHRNDECTTCHVAASPPIPGASFHNPSADCMACHAPAGAPRPANRFLKPMPHRMMMGMTAQKCLACHMF